MPWITSKAAATHDRQRDFGAVDDENALGQTTLQQCPDPGADDALEACFGLTQVHA
jgi:hypothetical protein